MYIEDPRKTIVRNLHKYVRRYESPTEFARKCHIPPVTMRDYLSGRRFPRPEQLQAIAVELDIPVLSI